MDGSGTEQDPYLITTVEQLQAVNQDPSAHYELICDINAEETSKWNNRSGFNPIGSLDKPFSGTFNGNNYKIRNICINRPDEHRVGLFGYITQGRVVNLGLVNSIVEGKDSVGSLIGWNNGKKIESSYSIEVDVSGNKKVGGLIGSNYGTVNLSYTVEVDVSGEKNTGGLIGLNDGGVESSHTVEVDVSGEKNIGGLIGLNYGEPSERSFVLSDSGESNLLEGADVVLSKGKQRISYAVETRILYVQINDKIYSGGKLSPIEVQPLLDGSEVVEMTDEFRASVVTATHKNK